LTNNRKEGDKFMCMGGGGGGSRPAPIPPPPPPPPPPPAPVRLAGAVGAEPALRKKQKTPFSQRGRKALVISNDETNVNYPE
jgi:hypothetical protein